VRVHYRDIGTGPPLVLLHSAGTGASQWRQTAERLENRFRAIMPNLRGYGRTPAPAPGADALGEEIAVVDQMATLANEAVHLVGHSLGALVAIHFAMRQPARVARLTLIEPIIIGTLREAEDDDARAARSLGEIGAMIAAFQAAAAAGDTSAAMRAFTEYWSGPGAWDDIPAAARLPFFARAEKMRADVDLAWADRTAGAALATIRCPALVLSAAESTPAAQDIAERVAAALPDGRLEQLAGTGHMAPVTDPGLVADALARFDPR